MGSISRHSILPYEHFIPWFFLAILLLFTYALLFEIPYLGLDYHPVSGEILKIFVIPPYGNDLRMGDRIVRLGNVSWEEFRANLLQPLIQKVERGEEISILVEREGQRLEVRWVTPGLSLKEFFDRFFDYWWLGYIFWLFGTFIAVFVRPKNILWLLLILFNNLLAVMMLANVLSAWHIWGSAIFYGVAIWLTVPVSLHLHWLFPKPLGRLPGWVFVVLYLGGFSLALLHVFQALPRNSHRYGILLIFLGGAILLILHYLLKPDQRRNVGLLSFVFGFASLPVIGLVIARLLGVTTWYGGSVALALPAIPGAYLFTLYRYQLDGMEYRVNRAISLYLFALILAFLSTVIAILTHVLSIPLAMEIFYTVGLVTLVGLISVVVFPTFEKWIEHHILKIPSPPKHILENYSAQIATSADVNSLIRLLKSEVLPSFLIRQSVLFQIPENGQPQRLFATGVEDSLMPTQDDLLTLMEKSGKWLSPQQAVSSPQNCPWVRLVLPLSARGRMLGLWLFGRRDPDDFYPLGEITTLRALADQTAIALLNIKQAESLRSLYQADIQRRESEATKMALFLHDVVLNRLALLLQEGGQSMERPELQQVYQSLVDDIREVISDLRPAVLNFGLHVALRQLADDLSERTGDSVEIRLDLSSCDAHYDPQVEVHLYRILQQACDNALRHAHASVIQICGELNPQSVYLSVRDDGIGMDLGGKADLARLLAGRHYGLVGMHERAALIGAKLEIISTPGQGTQVNVYWHRENVPFG